MSSLQTDAVHVRTKTVDLTNAAIPDVNERIIEMLQSSAWRTGRFV